MIGVLAHRQRHRTGTIPVTLRPRPSGLKNDPLDWHLALVANISLGCEVSAFIAIYYQNCPRLGRIKKHGGWRTSKVLAMPPRESTILCVCSTTTPRGLRGKSREVRGATLQKGHSSDHWALLGNQSDSTSRDSTTSVGGLADPARAGRRRQCSRTVQPRQETARCQMKPPPFTSSTTIPTFGNP